MRKILWLIFICALAAVIALWVILNPAVIGIFAHGYLIKLPLWLFIIAIIFALFVLWVLLCFCKALILTPKNMKHFFKRSGEKKQKKALLQLSAASVVKDDQYLLQNYQRAYGQSEFVSEIAQSMLFNELYTRQDFKMIEQKLKEVQSPKDSFSYHFYHALVLTKLYKKHTEALAIFKSLVKSYPASALLQEQIIEIMLIKRDLSAALKFVVGHKNSFADEQYKKMLLEIVLSISSESELFDVWKELSKKDKESPKLIAAYMLKMAKIKGKEKALVSLKKSLQKVFHIELVRLYLTLDSQKESYDFIKHEWQRHHTHQPNVLLLILPYALQYQDWQFIDKHLLSINIEKLDVVEKARVTLINGALSEHKSMHTQAMRLKAQAEKLLLNIKETS